MYNRLFLNLSVLIFVLYVFVPAAAANNSERNKKEEAATILVDLNYPSLYLNSPALQGDAVWMVQARLRELGYEIEPTGIYDSKTSEMVRLYQTANRLPANGVVTRMVWDALLFDPASEQCASTIQKAGKLRMEVDLIKHRLTVFHGGKTMRTYTVGVGKSKTPSPLGEWKVVSKGIDWGDGFGTRWMGLNVPWGIYGIHGTDKPYSIGSSQSHGCIRMQNRDVEKLYPMVPLGTMVKITENGQIFPRYFKPVHLYRKCSGQRVVYLQSRLKEKGIIFDNADGRFGSATELALKYYQAWHCLEVTGETNEETYRSLGMIK